MVQVVSTKISSEYDSNYQRNDGLKSFMFTDVCMTGGIPHHKECF